MRRALLSGTSCAPELFGARTELFALLGLLRPDAVVGDLGCGTGYLAEAMAPFVGRVIAIDESVPMLRAARARLAAFSNVEVRQGAIEALPVEPDELDHAMLSLVLHYVADPAQALAAIHRSLKAGGSLLIVDMLPHDHAEFRETMGHVWQGFGADQLKRWSEEAGFSGCRAHPLPPASNAKGPTLFSAVLTKP